MFKFWGKVRSHNKRGKTLGFPTANVNLYKQSLRSKDLKKIPEGIYISKTKIQKKVYPSLTFIGTAKTFEEKKYHAETYILDFNKNIYHRWISVTCIKKIRDNQKFKSVSVLVKQMQKDESIARDFFTKKAV